MFSVTESLTHAGLQLQAKLQGRIPADVKNPFDGVEPNFDVFGVKANKGILIALGVIWAISIVYSGGKVLTSLNKFNAAKSHHDSEGVTKGKEHVIKSGSILVGVVIVPVIVGALVAIGNTIAKA
ncbi:hypothetical protein [Arthrobacter sp. NyZ413]|uniref:hypothetical protein n=1 Tax=Arthrobacter sp. NyZ413 TaxID=3144669 RepID=UPI003BF818EC